MSDIATAIKEKIAGLETPTLIDMARKLYVDPRAEAGVIFAATLDALEIRMADDAFCRFCDDFD